MGVGRQPCATPGWRLHPAKADVRGQRLTSTQCRRQPQPHVSKQRKPHSEQPRYSGTCPAPRTLHNNAFKLRTMRSNSPWPSPLCCSSLPPPAAPAPRRPPQRPWRWRPPPAAHGSPPGASAWPPRSHPRHPAAQEDTLCTSPSQRLPQVGNDGACMQHQECGMHDWQRSHTAACSCSLARCCRAPAELTHPCHLFRWPTPRPPAMLPSRRPSSAWQHQAERNQKSACRSSRAAALRTCIICSSSSSYLSSSVRRRPSSSHSGLACLPAALRAFWRSLSSRCEQGARCGLVSVCGGWWGWG